MRIRVSIIFVCFASKISQFSVLVIVTQRGLTAPRKLKEGQPSLASEFPELAKQWHPTLNTHPETGKPIGPNEVSAGSAYVATWICMEAECGCPHVWQSPVIKRTDRSKRGCPFCSGFRTCHCNSLAAKFPLVAAEWDYVKNSGMVAADGSPLTPNNCPPKSGHKVNWVHKHVDGKMHPWPATVLSRTAKGSGCPICNRGGGCRENYRWRSNAQIWPRNGTPPRTDL